MTSRFSALRRTSVAALALVVLAVATGACSGGSQDRVLRLWTSLGGEIELEAQRKIIDAFEKENPGVKVELLPKSGRFTGDATALIAAVRGNSSPNVFIIDRFTTAQLASVGLLTNLQPRIDADEKAGQGNLVEEYLPFAANEASYRGDMYALPFDTDARGLFYNKKVLRDAGVDPARLDPKNGPITIDEMMEIGAKINKKDAKGNYTRMGVIPWDGQAFHATWALINNAQWFDSEKCEFTPQSAGWLKVMQDFAKWRDQLDRDKVSTFLATYRPPNQDPTQSPFYTGRIGMAIDGNWSIASIQKYAPKLDYGVTYLPVPKKGDKPLSWAGGFALTMPKGAPDADLTWKFMKFMSGPEGQRAYATVATKIPTWKALLDDPAIGKGQGIFPSLMDITTSRPALPVGAQVSDAMGAAQDAVLIGDATPEEAVEVAAARVGPQMKQLCPFQLTDHAN